MLWAEISVLTRDEAVDAVGNILMEAGAMGLAFEEGSDYVLVKAYLPVSDLLDTRIEEIKQRVSGLSLFGLDVGRGEIQVRNIPEEDWAEAWKVHYKPIFVGKDIMIRPTWYDLSPKHKGKLIIDMDPGMAFGSGVHYTTHSSIELLSRTLKRDEMVVDLGTGSGILAITAAKLGARNVLAIDSDEVAVEVARENVRLNGVEDRVVVEEGDVLEFLKDNPYIGSVDVVLANIIGQVIIDISPGVSRLLAPGGSFIAAGIILKLEARVKEAMVKAGLEVQYTSSDGEWVSICALKRRVLGA